MFFLKYQHLLLNIFLAFLKGKKSVLLFFLVCLLFNSISADKKNKIKSLRLLYCDLKFEILLLYF